MQEEKKVKTAIAHLEEQTKTVIDSAIAFEVSTVADVEKASMGIKKINFTLKEIEEKRKEITGPINLSLRTINNMFSNITHPLKDAKNKLNAKIVSWHSQEEQRVQEEQARLQKEEERRRKIQARHEEKGHEVSKPVEMEKPKDVENKIGSTYMVERTMWEVIDETKISRIYYSLDRALIDRDVKAGVKEIPGVRIWKEKSAVTR